MTAHSHLPRHPPKQSNHRTLHISRTREDVQGPVGEDCRLPETGMLPLEVHEEKVCGSDVPARNAPAGDLEECQAVRKQRFEIGSVVLPLDEAGDVEVF